MDRDDFAFANDVRSAIGLKPPRTYVMLIRVSAALLAAFFIWAYFAVLDEVTRGEGRVVPSRQMQIIQSLEGGLVEQIVVREGGIVQPGDVLMRIDDTNLGAQLGEVRERRAALAVRMARLGAEATGTEPIFADDLQQGAATLVKAERSLFDARTRKLEQDMEIARQQAAQKEGELAELQAQDRRLTQGLELLAREIGITRRMFQQGVVPQIEMIRAERQQTEMSGQLNVVKAGIGRAETGIAEAKARGLAILSTFRAAAEEELAKTRADVAILDETLRAARDRVRRTDLRSPVHGVINKVNVTTIGAVVQPGQAVIEIVPLEDNLLVEGHIRPADIGFIRPGQDAVVKITAYDSTIYGSLQGKVERISADTTMNEQKETFYRLFVRTTKNHLGTEAAPLPIIPGMIGSVEVLTGRKSVLDYLLKPVRKISNEALRER